MNSNLHKAARCFIATINNKLTGFISVLHFPHKSSNKFKQGHRIVVLPDFQGIGIGNKLLEFVSDYIKKQGNRFIATANTPALINYFKKNTDKWIIKRFGRNRGHKGNCGGFKVENSSLYKYTISVERK